MKEKFPGYDRIVGMDPQLETFIKLNGAKEIFENQSLEEYEREKTDLEKVVIFEILKKIPDFIAEYGADEARFTSSTQIHILDGSKTDQEHIKRFMEEEISGMYLLPAGRVEVLADGSIVETAHVVVHELMHANSFVSLTASEGKVGTEQPITAKYRRMGIEMFDKGRTTEHSPFHFLNEAVTEELTRRFCERHFSEIKWISEEFEKTKPKEAKGAMSHPVMSIFNETSSEKPLYHYLDERVRLATIVSSLYEANKDKFDSYEDVFKLFSKAAFTGRVLELAGLIEKTFGEGTFKKLGELTSERAPSALSVFEEIVKATPEVKSDQPS